MLGVARTLEYGTRAMLYRADLPRDLGVTKPFSTTSKFPGDLGTRDKVEDFKGLPAILNGVAFGGLLPMYAFAISAGEATSSSRT